MSEGFVVSDTGKRTIEKDPNDVLDYTPNWADWLAASGDDTINSVSWSVSGPDALLTVTNQTQTATAATVWLSGGTVGASYAVRCRVTTVGNRIKDNTFYVKIKEH